MSDPARRRRPSPPPPSRGGGPGGGPLPIAALFIGVIVAGIGIGALVSAFQNRSTVPELGATSIPAVTPVPQPSEPRPLATLPPTPSPAPSASRSPAPAPTRRASPKPSPTATATATAAAAATARATATPAPTAAPAVVTPAPAATVKPAAAAPPSPAPVVGPTLAPAGRPAVAAPSAGEAATALVRRYINDLIANDEAGAYAALGGSRSDRSLDLKEEAFLDKDARITSIHVTRTGPSGSTVDAEITSGRGSYVATFHVVNGPSGITINQHDYIKI